MQIAPTRSTAFDLNRSKKTTGQRNSNEPFSFLWPCLLKVHLSLHSIWVIYCKELFGNIDLDRSLKYVQQIREILKPTIVWSSFDQARMRVCLNPTRNYRTPVTTSSRHNKLVKKPHTLNGNLKMVLICRKYNKGSVYLVATYFTSFRYLLFKSYTPLHISTCNGNDTVFL